MRSDARSATRPAGNGLARSHGAFNVLSGLWPLLHRPSFEAVLGPKTDYWLVNTVAGLLVVNGLVQLSTTTSAEGLTAARRVGLGTASTLVLIDLIYVSKGRISPVYLLDATAEIFWIAAWARHHPGQTPG